MSRLQFPLGQHLVDPVDEEALLRMRQHIDARVPLSSPRRVLPFILAGSAVMVVLAVALLTVRSDSGPLHLAGGHPILPVEAGAEEATLALSDGSRIRLLPGARLEPLETSSRAFSAVLVSGSAHFDVRPNGPRRWAIECGLATVEVLGTEFACERWPGRLRVSVKRGTVLVRGERVPDRVRRLVAGQWMDVMEGVARAPVPAATPVEFIAPAAAGDNAKVDSPSESAHAEPANITSRRTLAASWRDLARRGQHKEAFTTLGAEGLRRETKRLGVADLLALADVARLSGHPTEAVAPLERILAEFSTDSQASLAAFALGRLEMDSLGRPVRAVSAFKQALALGIPHSLREDVMARLVEAYTRRGDRSAARTVAEAYTREFPQGRHRRAIEGWLADR